MHFLRYLKIVYSQVCFFSSRMFAFSVTNSILIGHFTALCTLVHPEAKIDSLLRKQNKTKNRELDCLIYHILRGNSEAFVRGVSFKKLKLTKYFTFTSRRTKNS